jgi:hypothetical protein
VLEGRAPEVGGLHLSALAHDAGEQGVVNHQDVFFGVGFDDATELVDQLAVAARGGVGVEQAIELQQELRGPDVVLKGQEGRQGHWAGTRRVLGFSRRC